MNVDSLARLIEGSDVAVFRSVVVDFLPFIGFDETSFSDGPYDGGLDFVVRTQKVNGLKIGFQISVERNWRQKVAADAIKAKNAHAINALYFISSRRVPEGSWITARTEVAKSTGLNLFKLDNQAIAAEFIRANAVNRLLEHYGIRPQGVAVNSEYLGPLNEAVSALLIFGSDARDFRDGMIDSMVKSFAARSKNGIARVDLIADVLRGLRLTPAHGALVNSHIDRLLQAGALFSQNKILSLSGHEQAIFSGLEAASRFEFESLHGEVKKYFEERNEFTDEEQKLVFENLLGLTTALIASNFHVNDGGVSKGEIYQSILDVLASRVGEAGALTIFAELSSVVAQSQFGRRIASARLYQCLLRSDSKMLTAALGGNRGLYVYLDTSVFIPMICGALFDPGTDRFGKSGGDLFDLLKEHEFSACIPADYLEEVAAHLVSACRDYRYLLEEGIDIIRSTNAFVSHYSSLKRSSKNESLTFDSYVGVFGINLAALPRVLSDEDFYRARDRAVAEIRRIVRKYGIDTKVCEVKHTARARMRIEKAMGATTKPPVLVAHDAAVVSFLEAQAVGTDDVNVLCTWDRIHAELNPAGESGYFVMSPVALIDFLSIGKKCDDANQVASLDEFIYAQTEAQIVLSARIWDAIAQISGSDISDAALIANAREFREDYLSRHAALGLISEEDIAKSWIAWQKKAA